LPLDYDRELQTVGWSNFVSGCCGGYTGSYIFSQTIFTLRRGVTDDSRVCGWYALFCVLAVASSVHCSSRVMVSSCDACRTIVFLEMVVVVAPVSVPSYVPKMFFGSLLVLIAVDLMHEWLIQVTT